METKFTAVAMRCNKEQFEAIKPKLEKAGCIIEQIHRNWNHFKYLVNNNFNIEKHITNFNNTETRKRYETWNEEIFLNACGIEVDEPLTVSKEFILDLHKEVVWPSVKAKIEREFPSVFEPKPTEMTVAEIEQKLGLKIKIVG